MTIGLKQHQGLHQTQKLIMTQQMQQSIKLLQMSAMELEQLATQEMCENPFLEMEEEGDSDEPTDQAADEVSDEEAPEDSADEAPDSRDEPDWEPSEEPPLPEDPMALADTPADPAAETPETFDQVDVDWSDYFDDLDSRPSASSSSTIGESEERDFTTYVAQRENLADSLKFQLHVSTLDEAQVRIGEYIIGNLDEDGYLRIPVAELAEDLKCPEDAIEAVLRVIQTFDPPGVGARTLPECLAIQLRQQGEKDPAVLQIVEEHLTSLQRKKFREIARDVGVDEALVRDVFYRIGRLEPKPGRSSGRDDVRYILPDVVVKKVDERYLIFLNEGRLSGLRLNNYYRALLQNGNGFSDTEKQFAQEKFRSAVWLVKNIEKRKSTILKVTEAIMDFQKDFLEKGTSGLRPLTLKQIAEVVGMHESTVARVTTSKYVETPRGIFELKYFFSSGLETDSGENASSTSIKDRLQQIIASENPRRPYSDQKLAEMLKREGINIARRTVAKYREQLKILSAKMRREVS